MAAINPDNALFSSDFRAPERLFALLMQAAGRAGRDGDPSVAVMLWSPLHNALFDWLDARWFDRVASDRHGMSRWVHAFSHEVSTLVVTLPLIVWMGGYAWFDALLLDLGLTLFYTLYAWVFHWCFDRLRPVKTPCTNTAAAPRRPS